MKTYKTLFTLNLKDEIEKFTRVDHAGEVGAVQIYKGQIDAIPEDLTLQEMLDGEIEHYNFFKKEIKNAGIRPSIFLPIWKKLSYAIGYISARKSREYAMLCTEAVESEIEDHYKKQIEDLDLIEECCSSHKLTSFKEKIQQFYKDEIHHKNIGHAHGVKNHAVFIGISYITKMAIIISEEL